MAALDDIRPTTKIRVMDLLVQLGMDVSQWSDDYRGDTPAANPKYCYNWSFVKPHEMIVTCLWHSDLKSTEGQLTFEENLRKPLSGKGAAQWKKRAAAFDEHMQIAYRDALPVRAIILTGTRRDAEDEEAQSSQVGARRLDHEPWAVTYYDFETGNFVLTRGVDPITEVEQDDPEYAAYEGEQRRLYVVHRRRESALRKKKLQAAMIEGKGSIICQVPRCGFDFKKRYGSLGEGFAHVHHLRPLGDAPAEGWKIALKDLAVVCPNCHAMIHRGGACRQIETLITV